jgi:hypothetical protein
LHTPAWESVEKRGRLGDQRLDHRFQGRGAEDHRFLAPARMQQPVGEDVPAFGVCAQLRLVERDEADLACGARHGLGGAEEIARLGRFDPFLAGDEGDLLVALDRAHPVIDLARQQPQREAHHPARMPAHPLDRQMGLAGVGRPEHRAHARIVLGGGSGIEGKCHDAQASVRLATGGQGRGRHGANPTHNTLPHLRYGWSLVNAAFTLFWQENATRERLG